METKKTRLSTDAAEAVSKEGAGGEVVDTRDGAAADHAQVPAAPDPQTTSEVDSAVEEEAAIILIEETPISELLVP